MKPGSMRAVATAPPVGAAAAQAVAPGNAQGADCRDAEASEPPDAGGGHSRPPTAISSSARAPGAAIRFRE